MHTWVFATCILVVLAGCSGVEENDPVAEEVPEETGTPVPQWNVGDYWAYESGADSPWSWTSVVTAMDSTSYTLDVDSEHAAFADTQEMVSFIGPQRKSDLAGSQEDGWVEWLQFPLEDGKRWQMNFDGAVVMVTASVNGDGTYTLSGSSDGPLSTEFTYNPEVRWFTERAVFHNGSLSYRNTLTEYGSNWTGEVVRYDVEEYRSGSHSGAGADSQTFAPPSSDWEELWGDFIVGCHESGSLAFAIGQAESAANNQIGMGESPGWSVADTCPRQVHDQLVVASAPYNGTWGYAFQSTTQDLQLDYKLLLRQAERIPFPQ